MTYRQSLVDELLCSIMKVISDTINDNDDELAAAIESEILEPEI